MLSVIVPNFNGEHYLPSLLDSLAQQQNATHEVEVIFVDNGSTDDSLRMLESFSARQKHSRVLVYRDAQSSYAARNHGAAHATNDVFVFTDADCIPAPDWVAQAEHLARTHQGPFLFTGSVELFPQGARFNPYEWYDKCTAMDQEKYSATQTGATANLLVSRSAFEAVGGFRPVESGGDRDFCKRIMQIVDVAYSYHDKLKVRHPARSSKAEIRKKAQRINRGLVSLKIHAHPKQKQWADLCKQVLGLLLMPNQWRIVARTFTSKQSHPPIWRFALVAFQEGAFARYDLIRATVRAMKTGEDHQSNSGNR